MISEYELANIITGATRAEGGVARKSSATILGKAVEDSENGMVRVVPEGDVFAPDGDNTIIIPTSPSVRAGDTVQIGLVGGVSKRPMVVAAGGEGDRQNARISEAELKAQQAKEAIEDAVEDVADIKQEIEDFKSGADVDYAIYSYVDDEIGEFSQTVSATYLSKTDAQTTYATQSQLTQTAENITASVSQDYLSKADAQTTYATKSELEVGLEGIELEVSQNYATKDEAATMGESSGESVTVDSGSRLRSLEVEGKSVQDGTPSPSAPVEVQVVSGANLLSLTPYRVGNNFYNLAVGTAIAAQASNADVTITENDGFVSIACTAAWRGVVFVSDELLDGNTYTLVYGATTTTGTYGRTIYTLNASHEVVRNMSSIISAEDGRNTSVTLAACEVYIAVAFGVRTTAGTVTVDRPHVCYGSTGQPYVPYGALGLRVTGKNLFDASKNVNGYYIDANGVPRVDSVNAYSGLVPVAQGGYVFSGTDSGTTSGTKRIHGYDANGTWVQQLEYDAAQAGSAFAIPFTVPAGIKYVRTSFRKLDTNLQIERGATATAYEPYYSTVTPIDLQGNVLASLQDGTKDVLSVDASGHCVITKRVGNSTFDGSETWGKSNYVFHTTALQQLKSNGSTPNAYSSAFRAGYINATSGTAYIGMFDMFSAANPYFRCSTDAYSDAASFKAWLSATPMQVVYELATAQTVDLGYITMPELADGCTVQILASLTPTFGASWYTENGAALVDFATKSELQVTADGISSEVSTKVGNDEVISKINQSAETIQIEAERIEFDGTVVFNAIKSETDAAYDAKGAAAAEADERKAIYGTCSTAAGTAAKAVTCADFQLFTGARIAVKFSTASTVAAPTLNVNGTGAKAVWYNNAVASASNPVLWGANAILNFVYDGTEWVLDEKPPSYSVACSTAAGTRDKAATIAGALIVNGTTLTLNFSMANTYVANSLRINLSSTGASTVYVNRAATSTTNTLLWAANTSLTFVRQGSWYLTDNGMRKNITHIDDNGVSIHAANNPTQNYLQLDATGTSIYEGGSEIAAFKAREVDLGLVPISGTPSKIDMNGGSFIIESTVQNSESNVTNLVASTDKNDIFNVRINDRVYFGMAEYANERSVAALAKGFTGSSYGTASTGQAGFSADVSTSDTETVIYGNHIALENTTSRIGDSSTGYSITQVYTQAGFNVENHDIAVSNDVVTIPIIFASTSSITWGNQVAATIPAAVAPPTQIRVFVYARNSWSGPLVPAWINIDTDGSIRINSDAATFWFGHATYVRKPAGWTSS